MEVMEYEDESEQELQEVLEDPPVEVANEDTAEQSENETKILDENSAAPNPVTETGNDSDTDTDQTCPICMDIWTSSGEHRLCCLRCGHLFGRSCILRWLQHACTSGNRRCPQCNKKAAVKDIRMLYAKKLTSIDTSELDKLKNELQSALSEKNHMQVELAKLNLREKLYEQQLFAMKQRITELESQQAEIHVKLNHSVSRHGNKKFHLERSLDICKDGGCRVLDYNPWHGYLVATQKSSTPLFSGYGIRKIDLDKCQLRQFVHLHSQPIRDMTFHSTQKEMLLSVSFDKCAKLMDIQSNINMHTYHTDSQLWSCCWSGDNTNIFFTGAQNGSVAQYDIRQTSTAVTILDCPGDRSPVISLATVTPNPGSGIGKGGFIACHFNTCYAYEQTNGVFKSKQMFLEGPFFSVRYDKKNHHALISSRPNARQPHARHMVCTIEKGNDEAILCNVVHTFHAGNSQQLLSRPTHIHCENDTLVAAHQESTSCVSMWSIGSGKQYCGLPVSDPVVDMCSFDLNNDLVLATLSAKKLRLYYYG